MQDFEVNLICVEDGIDSSKDSGKLMIYVLSAVTEIEGLEKQHRQLTGAKARLGQQMDSLDIMDKFYEKKYQDGVLGYVPVYEKWAFYCYFEKLRGVSGRANC